jgi:hypothetical protein
MIATHHEQVEAASVAVVAATTVATRGAAQKKLGIILTGHSNAYESVIYPALTVADEKDHATMTYTKQSAAKSSWRCWRN